MAYINSSLKTWCHKIYQSNMKTNEYIQGYYNSRLHTDLKWLFGDLKRLNVFKRGRRVIFGVNSKHDNASTWSK